MNKNGEIIIIEDDDDQCFILEQIFGSLAYPNKRIYFPDGIQALEYLHLPNVTPFIIISDIDMPILNGLELRRKLQNDAELSIRCIPYLFFSSAIEQKTVIDAYSISAQGFFIKPSSIEELQETIKVILDYWKRCAAPNHFRDRLY